MADRKETPGSSALENAGTAPRIRHRIRANNTAPRRQIEMPPPMSRGRDRPAVNGKKAQQEENYDVGYGSPPKHSRFKKGQSGNPKGRPKGARNVSTILTEILEGRVEVVENGRRRKVSRREGMLLRLMEKAMNGDLNAIKCLIALDPPNLPVSSGDDSATNTGGNSPFGPEADKDLADFIASVREERPKSGKP